MQVSATATGELLLTEQFDRDDSIAGLIDIQDELAGLTAGRVASRYGAVADHIGRTSQADVTRTWEMYRLLARFHDYYLRYEPEVHAALRDDLPKALERDPTSSQGWSAYAMILLEEHRFYMNHRPEVDALDLAHHAARRAVHADPQDAFAHSALALTRFYRKDLAGFRDAAERALDLNDGHADVLAEIGHCFAFIGEEERAIALLDRAIALSPVHPGWYHFRIAGVWQRTTGWRTRWSRSAVSRCRAFSGSMPIWRGSTSNWANMKAAREEAATMLALYPSFEAHAMLNSI